MPGYVIYLVSMVKKIKCRKNIVSHGISEVGIEFLVYGRVG